MENKERNEKILKVVCDLLGVMNIEAQDVYVEDLEVEEGAEPQVLVGMKLENPAHLIGFRGKNLAALQSVLGMMVKGQLGEWMRILVDINNYRDEQKTRLETMCKNAAVRVLESKGDVGLGPMSAYERRLCHMVVSGIEGVMSESEGEGEERHVVIKPSV